MQIVKLHLLAEAEGGSSVRGIARSPQHDNAGSGTFVLSRSSSRQLSGVTRDQRPQNLDLDQLRSALAKIGVAQRRIRDGRCSPTRDVRSIRGLPPPRETIREECVQRLREVDGEFVEPDVTVGGRTESHTGDRPTR